MKAIEAMDLWESGNKRAVRKACMDNPQLVNELADIMEPEEHALLRERIELHSNA